MRSYWNFNYTALNYKSIFHITVPSSVVPSPCQVGVTGFPQQNENKNNKTRVLLCKRLYWDVLGSSGLTWAVPGCNGLCWAAVNRTGVYRAVLEVLFLSENLEITTQMPIL